MPQKVLNGLDLEGQKIIDVQDPSSAQDAATKNYVDTRPANLAVPFYISGTLTTGVKLPEFIAPVAMTVTSMKGRCATGSSATYRPSKNGGTSDGTTSASTGQTVITTAQSVSLAAGDRLGLNVVAAGTGSDLSVTMWISVP